MQQGKGRLIRITNEGHRSGTRGSHDKLVNKFSTSNGIIFGGISGMKYMILPCCDNVTGRRVLVDPVRETGQSSTTAGQHINCAVLQG